MSRHLVIALAAAALAVPALAHAQYDDGGGGWSQPPPAPDDGSAESRVDVNVDLATPGASVTFQTFHDGLEPYGEWVNAGGYGHVWRPAHVAAGWRPYYYGRWEWTDEGWLWVSDEPWGWAAYHYGRWAYDPYYGWVWVPGYQWAPAWVTWRYSPEYIGWAPLAPGFSVYVTAYPVHYAWWSFVPCNRFVGYPVHTVAYTGGYVPGIFHHTQPAPPRANVFGAHAPAWGGPARPFVENRIGHTIVPARVQPVGTPAAMHRPMAGGVIPVFRPEGHGPRVPAPAAVAPRPYGGGTASAQPYRPAPAPLPAGQPWRPAPGQASNHRPEPSPGNPGPRPLPQQYAPGQRPMPQQQYTPGPRPMPPQQYAPGPRPMPQQQYAPGPRPMPQQQPAPGPRPMPQQQYAPGSRPVPQPQHDAPAPRSGGAAATPQPSGGYAPGPRGGGSFAAAAPHGGGGGGFGHGASPAPHRR